MGVDVESKRSEFPPSVRLKAFRRASWCCEKCTAPLSVGKFQYDHIIPDGLGGKPTLENCMVLCDACHKVKTHLGDRPIMTKADNQRKAHIGAKPAPARKIQSRGFPKKERPRQEATKIVPRRPIYKDDGDDAS